LSIKKHKKIHGRIFKEYLTDIESIATGRIAHFADFRPKYFQQDNAQFLFKFLDDLPIKR